MLQPRSLITALIITTSIATMPAPKAEDAPTVRDFKAVDAALIQHKPAYTGNADIDFRTQLIARRQNIIDMSEVALARANDPSTEALAQKTIDRQKHDIAELQQWISTNK